MKDEIRKALDAATPGLWEWRKRKWEKGDGEYKDGEFCVGELKQKSEPGKSYNSILDIQKNKHGYPEIYAWEESDALLIANAPTWLRALLEENEQLAQITAEKTQGWGECEAQNQQLREENERITKERDEWKNIVNEKHDELCKVTKQFGAEIEKATQAGKELASLCSELAAKDKALQMIANAKVHSCDSAYQLTQIAQQTIGVTHET